MDQFSMGILLGIGVVAPMLVSWKWATTFLQNLMIGLVVYVVIAGPTAFCTMMNDYATLAASHSVLTKGSAVGVVTAGVLRIIFGLSK